VKINIAFVIPLYNEEDVFEALIGRLKKIVVDHKSLAFKFILVDDGSTDATKELLLNTATNSEHFKALILSRNFGHQIAVTAGLSVCEDYETVMIIDGDLQDPPELCIDFYNRLNEGYDVVYGIRKKRKESVVKRSSYYMFYRLLNRISGIHLPEDSGDFCMITNRIIRIMNAMPEQSRYLRGMRAWVGFKQIGFPYERQARFAGEPKYNFKMLAGLAYNGIFNFSDYPIKLVTGLGAIGVSVSIIYFIYNLAIRLLSDEVPTGFTALVFLIILFGSIQLVFLGVLGEYIIRIFFQSKNRPNFLIEKIIE